MASIQFIAFALVAIFLPTLTPATQHTVGDDKGWTVNFNYSAWATGKVFHVGDTLVFNYKAPHNVLSVDGEGFKNCAGSGEPRTSGNDTITLKSSGKKWYICTYGKHCAELGQKLVINVEAEAPTPTPVPDHAYGLAPSSWYHIFVAAAAVLAMVVA